jgi:hypothetical protein
MLGSQKMELKTTFPSLEAGYERLSKVVRERVEKERPQSAAKKRRVAQAAEDEETPPAFPTV